MTAIESLRRLAVGAEPIERPVLWGIVGGLIVGYGSVPIVGGGLIPPETYVLAIAIVSALASLARASGAGGVLACVFLAWGPIAGALVGASRYGTRSEPGVGSGLVPPEILGGSIPVSLGIAFVAALVIGGLAFLVGGAVRRFRNDR
ncbi:hypothetical protein ACERIT_11335 [Halopenitus sp. H-Gu1]|uniref:hypothetical protein n=1 Tax=Halopenitus sp. H-Gu1 TaxID=3242697 RepID=UPI00359DD5F1